MPIPSTGPLAFSTIQTEFGGSNPISLSEYYAGGARVPSGTTGINGAVPTSGAIAVSKFYGTSAVLVTINDESVFDFQLGTGTAVAAYTLLSSGDIRQTQGVTNTDIGDWVTPKSAASNYECRATLVSGTLSSGTTGSWLALTTNRSWSCERSSFGVTAATISLEIRKIGTTTVLDTATISLQAEWEL